MRVRMNKPVLLLCALLLGAVRPLVGCSGVEFSAAGATGGGGVGSGGAGGKASAGSKALGTGGSGVGSAGKPSGGAPGVSGPCPALEPAPKSACSPSGLSCTYGSDPRPNCRSEFSCSALGWEATFVAACERDSSCPMVAPSTGTDCVSLQQVCTYPDDGVVCGCPKCPAFCASERWLCVQPPSGGCPKLLPNAGAPCDDAAAVCQYGECRLGASVQASCDGESWLWERLACAETPTP